MVDHTMTAHCTTLNQRSIAGAPICTKMRFSQQAAYTAEATCSEGQALPAASTLFMKASCGCCDQSMSSTGVWVGNTQNSSRQKPHNAAVQRPCTRSVRRLGMRAAGSDT